MAVAVRQVLVADGGATNASVLTFTSPALNAMTALVGGSGGKGVATLAGSTLVIFATNSYYQGHVQVSAADSGGVNVYTNKAVVNCGVGNGTNLASQSVGVYKCDNAAALVATATVSATASGSEDFDGIIFVEFTGGAYQTLVSNVQTTSSSGTNAITTGNITTTVASTLLYSMCFGTGEAGGGGPGAIQTVGTGFTLDGTCWGWGSTNTVCTTHITESSTGTYAVTYNNTVGSAPPDYYISIVLAIAPPITPASADIGAAFDAGSAVLQFVRAAADSGAGNDAQSQILTFAAAQANAGAAADSASEIFAVFPTLTDVGSAADSTSQLMTAALSFADAGAATDSSTQTMTASVATADAGQARDSASELMTASLSQTDAGAAADGPSQTMQAPVSVADLGTALDVQAGINTQFAGQVDAGQAADLPSAGQTVLPSQSDAAQARDTVGNTLAIGAAQTDAGAAVEAFTQATVESVGQAEAGAAAEAFTQSTLISQSQSDAGQTADQTSQGSALFASQADAGAAIELTSLGAAISAGQNDVGAAADSNAGALAASLSAPNAGSAADGVAVAGFSAAVSVAEFGQGADASTPLLAQFLTVIETGAAFDVQLTAPLILLAIAESGRALDAPAGVTWLLTSVGDVLAALDLSAVSGLSAGVTAAESGASVDAQASGLSAALTSAEAGSTSDAEILALALTKAAAESARAGDAASIAQVPVFLVSVNELASASDALLAWIVSFLQNNPNSWFVQPTQWWSTAPALQAWATINALPWWAIAAGNSKAALMAQAILQKRPTDSRQYSLNCVNLLVQGATIASVTSITCDVGALTFGTPIVNTTPVSYPDGTVAPTGMAIQVNISGGSIPSGFQSLMCTITAVFIDSFGQTITAVALLDLTASTVS